MAPPEVPQWLRTQTAKRQTEAARRRSDPLGVRRADPAPIAARPVYHPLAGQALPPWLVKANENTEQARKKLDKAQHPGLLGQVGHIIESTPVGLARFVGDVGHDVVYAPIKEIGLGARDIAQGRLPGRSTVKTRLPRQVGESFQRTGEDIVHPGRFVQAYREGNIVGKALEDVANLSVVGSVAARPLTAVAGRAVAEEAAASAAEQAALREVTAGAPVAGLEQAGARATAASAAARRLAPVGRVGEAIESAAKLGAQGANAPIKPIEWAGRGLRRVGETEVGQRLAATPVGRGFGELRSAAEQRRFARDWVAERIELPFRQAEHDVTAAGYQATEGGTRRATRDRMTKLENQVATVISDGTMAFPQTRQALREAAAIEGEHVWDDYATLLNEESKGRRAHQVTGEGLRAAADFHDGLSPAESAARIERGVGYQGRLSEIVQEAQNAPGARLTGPLPQENLEPALRPSKIATPEAEAALETARGAEAKAGERLLEVEGRETAAAIRAQDRRARGVERVEAGGGRQVALEARRQRLASRADELWAQADEARLRGDEQAARAAEDAALKAGRMEEASAVRLARLVEQRRPEGHLAQGAEYAESQARIRQAAAQRLGTAGEVTGQRAQRLFEGGLRQEETAARLGQRAEAEIGRAATGVERIVEATKVHEAVLGRAESVRTAGEARAAQIAQNANDAAELLGTRATATEATRAGLEGQTPLRDVAQREVRRAATGGEEVGARAERTAQARKAHEQAQATTAKAREKLLAERKKVRLSLDAAPPKYRYALDAARKANDLGWDLAEKLRAQGADFAAEKIEGLLVDHEVTLAHLIDAGIDPTYLPGGFDPHAAAREGRLAQIANIPDTIRNERALRQSRLAGEQERQTLLRPTTLQGRAAVALREIRRAIENKAAHDLLTEKGVTAEQVLGTKPSPNQLAADGYQLRQDMRERGFEAFDPRVPDSTPSVVNADTVFLDRHLKRSVGNYFKPESDFEIYARHLFDPIRRTWKDLVLPLSGQWHVGNIVSNAVQNTIGTGSQAWVGELPEAWRGVRQEGHGVTDLPARLFGLHNEADLTAWLRSQPGKGEHFIRRQLDRSYRLNTFFDDLSRSAVFMAEQRRGLAAGLTETQARDEALRTALKVSGDFTNMTKLERGFVRRAMPFYAWQRHVTRLVSSLAVEHPIRLVWTLHLADAFNDTDPGFPFGDAFGVAGGFVSVGNLSPLGQFQNLYFNERGPAAGFGQALGPELDVAAAATMGINLGRGFTPLRLPPGEGRLDAFGNPTNTPLLGRPRSLASYAVRQVPLVNTTRQLIEGRKLAEYDTGEPILKGGRLIDSTPRIIGTDVGGRLGILARQAGVPTVSPFDVEQSLATAAKRRETAAKAAQRYRTQLARAEKRKPA